MWYFEDRDGIEHKIGKAGQYEYMPLRKKYGVILLYNSTNNASINLTTKVARKLDKYYSRENPNPDYILRHRVKYNYGSTWVDGARVDKKYPIKLVYY